MFLKSNTMSKTTPNSNAINIIGQGTKITGDITCDSDIRIDGMLEGNIKAEGKIILNKSGKIQGNISCKNCDVSGNAEGTIEVAELLALKESSNINGDIVTKKMSVEPGAIFNGTCKMGGKSEFSKSKFNEKPEKKQNQSK